MSTFSLMLWTLVGFPMVALILSLVGTGLVRRYLLRREVLDHPNERSNHAIPTPRGGGIAVIASILLLWALAPHLFGAKMHPLYGLLPPALLLAGISWLDDLSPRPAWLRFGVQILAVGLGLSSLSGPILPDILPGWADTALTAFLWLWFINLFNFMDGIDGISGTETVTIAGGLAIITLLAGIPDAYFVYGAVIAGAAMGFLIWNWHPARIFLGDVGSVPLGFLLGFLLLETAARGYTTVALILPAYYLADAGLTLLLRLRDGEKIWQAHSRHFYQQAVRAGKSHAQVVITILMLNVVLLALAIAVTFSALPEFLSLALAYLATGGIMWHFSRRPHRPAADKQGA